MEVKEHDDLREVLQARRKFYCLPTTPRLRLIPVPYAEVAQLVEQWTENPCVGGSSPPLGTTFAN